MTEIDYYKEYPEAFMDGEANGVVAVKACGFAETGFVYEDQEEIFTEALKLSLENSDLELRDTPGACAYGMGNFVGIMQYFVQGSTPAEICQEVTK